VNPQPCQRWRERRDTYRPAGEPIDPRRYGVEVVLERDARAFVERHHYSASFPAARLSVGLWRSRGAVWAPELAGVAVFSVSVQPAAVNRWCGTAAGVELGRFVLLDEEPANAETWFLARAFRELRAALPAVRAVLAYSDPVPRTTAGGAVVMPGHLGIIYQAHNGRSVGRSRRRTLVLDADGRVVSERSLSKIRLGERGAGPAADRLVAAGAPRSRLGEEPAAWVERALREGPFRRLTHPGNHAYAWPLDRHVELPPAVPRPKVLDLQEARP
jgi:hypothetical protein